MLNALNTLIIVYNNLDENLYKMTIKCFNWKTKFQDILKSINVGTKIKVIPFEEKKNPIEEYTERKENIQTVPHGPVGVPGPLGPSTEIKGIKIGAIGPTGAIECIGSYDSNQSPPDNSLENEYCQINLDCSFTNIGIIVNFLNKERINHECNFKTRDLGMKLSYFTEYGLSYVQKYLKERGRDITYKNMIEIYYAYIGQDHNKELESVWMRSGSYRDDRITESKTYIRDLFESSFFHFAIPMPNIIFVTFNIHSNMIDNDFLDRLNTFIGENRPVFKPSELKKYMEVKYIEIKNIIQKHMMEKNHIGPNYFNHSTEMKEFFQKSINDIIKRTKICKSSFEFQNKTLCEDDNGPVENSIDDMTICYCFFGENGCTGPNEDHSKYVSYMNDYGNV